MPKIDSNVLKKALCDLSTWCIKFKGNINESYFNSLTLTEQVEQLFWVVKTEGALVEKAVEEFNELYKFVNDYFDNLDVQDEINNKLEEMAKSGELQNIILNFTINYVVPQAYGAKADGTTDDTNAINEALKQGKPVYFPPGTYACNNIESDESIIMHPDAILKYNGTGLDNMITLAGNHKKYDINIDCDNKNPHYAIYITGDANHFKHVMILNMYYNGSQPVNAGVAIEGDNNSFDFIHTRNFTHAPKPIANDSGPQSLATLLKANGTIISQMTCESCVSGVVHSSNGTIIIDSIIGKIMEDNCVYCVRSGHADIGQIKSYDCDETLAVITDEATSKAGKTTVNVNSIIAYNSITDVLRFRDAGDINIDSIIAYGDIAQIMLLYNDSSQITTDIYIGSIKIDGFLHAFSYCPSTRGIINSLHIGFLDMTCRYRASWSESTASFGELSSVRQLVIEKWICRLIDYENTLALRTFTFDFSGCDKISFIGRIVFRAENSSGALTNLLLRIVGIPGNYIVTEGMPYDSTKDYMLYSNDLAFNIQFNNCTAPPSVGYHRVGELILSRTNNDKIIGWYCSASGTPGTWNSIPRN